MSGIDQQQAWEQVAAHYQRNVAPDAPVIHYGPWAPPENELQLLGELRGLDVLELGCGGGQCSVAFALAGARVTGLDISKSQIEFARTRAAATEVAVTFVEGNAAQLEGFESDQWDLIFAAYTLIYVEPLARSLEHCWRLLRKGGRLVFCQDHPTRTLFYDEVEQENAPYPVRSYFDRQAVRWRFRGAERPMQHAHYTIGDWVDLLRAARFELLRLVEPTTPFPVMVREWPEDSPLWSMRNVPQTVIFVARKAPLCSGDESSRATKQQISDSNVL